MILFSLSFNPTPEDYISYSKKAEPALLSIKLKRGLIPFLIMLVAGFFFDLYFSVLALSLFAVNNLVPFVLNREYMKKQLTSRIIKRPVRLDFYQNHIVQTFLPDENYKGTNEKHFALGAIAGVVESDEYFYILTKAANVINIPKRILDDEKYAELKKITEDYFSGIYTRI